MIYTYIGLQGSGKTSHASYVAQKYISEGYKVYSNVDIKGCIKYNVYNLGRNNIFDGILIFDEAGIDINNRSFSKKGSVVNTQEFIEFWKKIRHDGIKDAYVYSQAWDYDMTVKRLCKSIFIIKEFILGYSLIYECLPKWDFDSEGQPIIKWELKKFPKFFNRKPYYKYFDSVEHKYKKPLDVEFYNNMIYSNKKNLFKYKIKRIIHYVENIHFPKLRLHFPKLH